jgi:hypothetical protein
MKRAVLFFLFLAVGAFGTLRLEAASPILLSNRVLADLDGDHKVDLAEIRHVGREGEGFLYRIYLELSGEGQRFWTLVDSDSMGLEIDAVDVDGDHDLDVVVNRRFLGQRVGVWVNDGKGTFTEAPVEQYPAPTSRQSFEPANASLSGQAAIETQRRLFIDLESGWFVAPPSFSGRNGHFLPSSQAPQWRLSLRYLRGPPVLSSF